MVDQSIVSARWFLLYWSVESGFSKLVGLKNHDDCWQDCETSTESVIADKKTDKDGAYAEKESNHTTDY